MKTQTFLQANLEVLTDVHNTMTIDGFDGIDSYENYLDSLEDIQLHSSDIDEIVIHFEL